MRLSEKISSLLDKVKGIETFSREKDKKLAISTFKKVQPLDKKLQASSLYNKAVEPELQSLLTIFHGFWDDGLSGTEEEQLSSIKNILSRKMIEVQAYLTCMKETIAALQSE